MARTIHRRANKPFKISYRDGTRILDRAYEVLRAVLHGAHR